MWQERGGEFPAQPVHIDAPASPPPPSWATRLRRHAFLLVLLGVLPLALLFPGAVGACVDWLPARAVVALALFLMAWGLEGRRLLRAVLRPWPALGAVALGYTVAPLLAWAARPLLPAPDLGVGLLLMASVPCTLASAVLWTRLAGGDEATALLAVLVGTLLSPLLTPLWLSAGAGPRVELPVGELMLGLALVLVLPVALGQGCRAWAPLARLAERGKGALGTLSQVLVLAILLQAVVDLARRQHLLSVGPLLATGLVALLIHLAALSAGLWGSRVFGASPPVAVAVAFACSQKTLPVALYLFREHFQADYPLAVASLVLYHVGQLVADSLVADWLRR